MSQSAVASARRFGLWMLLFVLLLVGMSWLSIVLTPENIKTEEFYANRSIYNAQPTGYKAWHQVVTRAGLPLSVWRKPFSRLTELPDSGATMLLIEPLSVVNNDVILDEQDATRLLNWVGKGNTLVFLDRLNRKRVRQLAVRLGIQVGKANSYDKSGKPDEDDGRVKHSSESNAANSNMRLATPPREYSGLSAFISRSFYSKHQAPLVFVTSGSNSGEIKNSSKPQVLAVDKKERPVLAAAPYRKGIVILGGLTDLASNEHLARTGVDNYQLFTNLATLSGKPIYVNEYVHGHGVDDNLLVYLNRHTPLGKIATQLAFAFLVLLWWSFLPWRPRRQPLLKEDRNIDIREFVQSLAGIYYKANASSLALGPYLQRIDQVLQKRYRLKLGTFSVQEEARFRQLLAESFVMTKEGLTPDMGLTALREAQEAVARGERGLSAEKLLSLSQILTRLEKALLAKRTA